MEGFLKKTRGLIQILNVIAGISLTFMMSLTVVDVIGDTFSVAVIPHTSEVTNLGGLDEGAPVNIEVDIVAKYVERMALPHIDHLREERT